MLVAINDKEKQFLLKILQDAKADTNAEKKMLAALINRVTKTGRIKPRSAKQKGLDWQKEVCALVSDITGIEYNQQDDTCEIHSRESGLNGTDVILRGKAKEKFPFSIECKNCKTISLPDWVRQAESNCDALDNWLLFIKSPVLPCKKVVVLAFSKFREIMGGQ